MNLGLPLSSFPGSAWECNASEAPSQFIQAEPAIRLVPRLTRNQDRRHCPCGLELQRQLPFVTVVTFDFEEFRKLSLAAEYLDGYISRLFQIA